MPQGFVYQLIIFSSWGDPYYVGLTGIEIYDSDGYPIRLTKDSEFNLSSGFFFFLNIYPRFISFINLFSFI